MLAQLRKYYLINSNMLSFFQVQLMKTILKKNWEYPLTIAFTKDTIQNFQLKME